MSQINAVAGVVKARAYIVMLRKIQEAVHLGIIHTQRIDTKDNIADLFTKPLPVMPFWRLSTSAIGDQYGTGKYTDIRDLARSQEISGGSVRELGSQLKEAANKAKLEARASKNDQRAREVENRQLQLAAMVSALELANKALLAHTRDVEDTDRDAGD